MMARTKRKFSQAERYAIWHCNAQRCWRCKAPLRLTEVTVDHVLPESLLDDEDKFRSTLVEYGLSSDFNINDYENWLPCHSHCNQAKGNRLPEFIPGNKAILDGLAKNASHTKRTAMAVSDNIDKDNVFKTIFVALECQKISLHDLSDWLNAFVDDPAKAGVPDDVLVLDSGYWVPRDQIALEGVCRCEREVCVGRNEKTYCYFQSSLSSWVKRTGLFWRCYDETIICPRCSNSHKRGHVGRNGDCERPYLNQELQSD